METANQVQTTSSNKQQTIESNPIRDWIFQNLIPGPNAITNVQENNILQTRLQNSTSPDIFLTTNIKVPILAIDNITNSSIKMFNLVKETWNDFLGNTETFNDKTQIQNDNNYKQIVIVEKLANDQNIIKNTPEPVQNKPTIVRPTSFGDSKINLPFSDAESTNPYLKIPDFVKTDILSKLNLNCTSIIDCQNKINKLALADQTVYKLKLDENYIPDDLVNITKMGLPAITDGYKDVYLTKEAANKLQAFINAAKQLGYNNLVIRYGYRSYEVQSDLYQGGERAAYVAEPGYSMHQSGIAFDLYKSKNDKLVSAVDPTLIELGYEYGIIHPLDGDAPHWVVADAAVSGFVKAVTDSGIDLNSLTIRDKQELLLQTMLAASQKYEEQIIQMSNSSIAIYDNTNISQLPDSTQTTTDSSVSKGHYNKELVYYSQKDPRWADVPLTLPYDEDGNRSKFREYGCGETATAMFLATYVDPSITPEDVLQDLYPPVAGGTGISLEIEVLNSYGFKTEPVYGGEAQIKEYIKNGKYVALGIKFSSGVTHHTIAVGVDENNNIILQDPYMGNLVSLNDISATIIGGYLVEPPDGSI